MTFFQTLSNFFSWIFGSKKNNEQPKPDDTGTIEGTTPDPDDVKSEFTLSTPQKASSSISGSEFVKTIMNLTGSKREDLILKEFLSGNVPEWNKNLIPVEVSDGKNKLTYYAVPNYLTIGSDDDWFVCPMTPITAQKIANAWGGSLVTKKMVDQIYNAADNKLVANPFGPPYDASMESTTRFVWNNNKIKEQLVGKDLHKLSEGHKKNIVLSNGLVGKNKVAIYGWWQNGKPIQGPSENATSHSNSYVDYAHGCRLVAQEVLLNGSKTNITEIFKDPTLSKMLNEGGMLKFIKYST